MQMAVMRIRRHGYHFRIQFLETVQMFRKGNNFRGTDIRKVKRIEQNNQIPILIVIQRYIDEFFIFHGSQLEMRGLLSG